MRGTLYLRGEIFCQQFRVEKRAEMFPKTHREVPFWHECKAHLQTKSPWLWLFAQIAVQNWFRWHIQCKSTIFLPGWPAHWYKDCSELEEKERRVRRKLTGLARQRFHAVNVWHVDGLGHCVLLARHIYDCRRPVFPEERLAVHQMTPHSTLYTWCPYKLYHRRDNLCRNRM